MCPKHHSEIGPVVALVGRNCRYSTEVPTQHLPADLRIMWLGSRAVNVENRAARTVHEERRL
jgi:hypothetical protein